MRKDEKKEYRWGVIPSVASSDMKKENTWSGVRRMLHKNKFSQPRDELERRLRGLNKRTSLTNTDSEA